jgi:hypothetical protein
VEHGANLNGAVILAPALTFRVNPRFSFKLGYTYYDTAGTVGEVRGNAVKLESDYKF